MRILITGACGFLGHHVVEHFLRFTDWDIVGVDYLSYASSGYDRLRDIDAFDSKRVTIIGWDISHPAPAGVVREIGCVDYLLHLAAETHVDRSISDALPFVKSNALGTQNVINLVRENLPMLRLMVNFSTDEVFGPAPDGIYYREYDRFAPTNPYAATKAAAVYLCDAAVNTHRLPICTTFTMNIFGERQDPEKFIPMCIKRVLAGQKIEIHADQERKRSGSRCWIHARNVAAALHWLLGGIAAKGQRYNIVGEEKTNLQIAQLVAREVGKPLEYELTNFHEQRPGHDLRYALDGGKVAAMGWQYPRTLEESLVQTVRWTLDRQRWLRGVGA